MRKSKKLEALFKSFFMRAEMSVRSLLTCLASLVVYGLLGIQPIFLFCFLRSAKMVFRAFAKEVD